MGRGKQANPTCFEGHRSILDRRAVGPWTYTGVRSNFHGVHHVGPQAVEGVSVPVGRQTQFFGSARHAGLLISQRVFRYGAVAFGQHRRHPGELQRAAGDVSVLGYLRIPSGNLLRHSEFSRRFLSEARFGLGGDFEDVRGPSVDVADGIFQLLGAELQRGKRVHVLAAELQSIALHLQTRREDLWGLPAY